MDFKEILTRDLRTQEGLLREYDKQLRGLPDYGLTYKCNGDKMEYYLVDSRTKKRRYINKNESPIIEDLKRKKYIEHSMKIMKNNIAEEKKLLEIYMPYDYDFVQRILPKAYRDGAHRIKSGHEELDSENCLRGRVHLTSSGIKVRSKSEVMIAEVVSSYNLRFEYERSIELWTDGEMITVHPDFTFDNKYGQSVYWEHFGMLGVEQYRKSALRKLNTYIENGIIPSVNLIITAEALDGSIDVNSIVRNAELLVKML